MMKTKMKVIMVLTINRTIMKTASWMKNMPLKNKRTVTCPKELSDVSEDDDDSPEEPAITGPALQLANAERRGR